MIVADEVRALATIGDKLIDRRPIDSNGIILGLSIYQSNIKLTNRIIS